MWPPLLLLLFGAGPGPAEALGGKGPGAWPWQASFFVNERYRCEGALISPEWVLTSADCFGSWPLSLFNVTLGPYRLWLDACEVQLGVQELLLSSEGPRGTGPAGLALARLAQPPPLSSAVWPVPLATRPQAFLPWQPCWAQGFRPDIDPYVPPRELHSLSLRPLHINACKKAFLLQSDCPDLKDSLPEGSQCSRLSADPAELVAALGTSLVCSRAGSWWLQGVMSWSPCWGHGLPEIYTPVPPFLSWIQDRVSNVSLETSAKMHPWAWPRTGQRKSDSLLKS